MKIVMYGIVWNEMLMLPYFFRHYDQFVSQYVIYDHSSDDGTRELLTAHPRVTLRNFEVPGESVIHAGMVLKSQAWKESRGQADLVLVCDVDELIWHPNLEEYLTKSVAAGQTLFRPCGWDMVWPTFPVTTGQIYDEVRQGIRTTFFDKMCLFNPNQIQDINYTPGCHGAVPTGNVAWQSTDAFKLLHFKSMGADYVIDRYAALAPKLKSVDRANGWGAQYRLSPADVRRWISEVATQPVFD